MNQNRFPYIAMHGRVNGCRRRERPRKRWIDSAKKDCEARGLTVVETERVAQDRLDIYMEDYAEDVRAYYCIVKALKEERRKKMWRLPLAEQ